MTEKMSAPLRRTMEFISGHMIGIVMRPDHGNASTVERPNTIVRNVCEVCGAVFEAKLSPVARLKIEDTKALVNHVIDHMYEEES